MRATKLLIVQDGATAEELQRGSDAAMAFFESAGVAPWDAAHAALKVKDAAENAAGWFSAREFELAALWDRAGCVAADACCAGWAKKPKTVCLRLVDPFEERIAAALADLYPDSGALGALHDVTSGVIGQTLTAMTERGVPEPIAMQSITVIVTNLLVEWIGPDGAAGLLRHMADKIDAERLH
ncbi:hypothetical protein FHP25_29805 [Vineibacter terrae]|uniref:Uncharacterized protein n=1 Tax=Vineibacter terrae TaxID=2586908 RepID=A0A5C8PDH7_9HYPH|nr:hypothetical protein [Vineibacter terrae]TXL71572.1 hypothetical protein FHP25_29805 [Vineibacter terrae]